MPVSSSGLVAGKNFPVHPRDMENESHRRKMVRGINQASAAAFTPETQLATFDTPVTLNNAGYTDLAIDITVTPFIPARAHVIFTGQFTFTGATIGTVRITENNDEIAVVSAGGADIDVPVTLQTLRDLQPDTTYIYEVEGIETIAGAGSVDASAGTFTVRVEARRLGI